jgi:hypothetical protein
MGFLGEPVAVWQAIGPGNAARPIVVVDPEIDRAGIVRHRMQVHNPRRNILKLAGRED